MPSMSLFLQNLKQWVFFLQNINLWVKFFHKKIEIMIWNPKSCFLENLGYEIACPNVDLKSFQIMIWYCTFKHRLRELGIWNHISKSHVRTLIWNHDLKLWFQIACPNAYLGYWSSYENKGNNFFIKRS